ncbi:MAG: hypothetical protein L0154_09075 [Chloroflexi bacterium]|nr:hypothetical protein [Chloroflexota bacterium]
MSDDAQNPTEEQNEDRGRRLFGAFQQASGSVRNRGRQLVQNVGQTAHDLQRRVGEDYYAILDTNTLVLETFELANLIDDDPLLLSTVFNEQWITHLLWTGSIGRSEYVQRSITKYTDDWFHKGPGHLKAFNEVNKYMDNIKGSGHRLKHGHSFGDIPDIYAQFGPRGMVGFTIHLIQDFMSLAGIPITNNAWNIKRQLETFKIPKQVATSLVSINSGRLLSKFPAFTVMFAINQEFNLARRAKKHITVGNEALAHDDFVAAIENYRRALDLDRNPGTLITLGMAYTRQKKTRLHAYHAFVDTVGLLSTDLTRTIEIEGVKLSMRGYAGLLALSCCDVLSETKQELWEEYIREHINGTINSFRSTALELQRFGAGLTPNLGFPPYLSAAVNYVLAARTAIYYPLLEDRRDKVLFNLKSSLECLALIPQYDEEKLRPHIRMLQELWARELLMPDEIETELATYLH